MRATTTTGTRILSAVASRITVKTGATRSPTPGTSPMIASSPKRTFVPGTLKALSSSTAQRRSASMVAADVGRTDGSYQ